MKHALASLFLWCASTLAAFAHEVRPAYLELRQTAPEIYDVLWKVPARGENLRLALYVRFPADARNVTRTSRAVYRRRLFGTLAHPAARWTRRARRIPSRDCLQPKWTRSFASPTSRASRRRRAPLRIRRRSPSPRTASRWQVAGTYLVLGIEHILLGIDHLLFVLALVLLVKGWKRLVGTITAFTVAHSITLAARDARASCMCPARRSRLASR